MSKKSNELKWAASLVEALESRLLLSLPPSLVQSVAHLSSARWSPAGTSVGDTAFFAGGGNSGAEVDIYDAATGRWSTAALSVGRGDLAAVSVGDKAIFAGGDDPILSGQLNTVDIYDDTTGVWSTASLSEPRGDAVGATAGNDALIGGGQYADTTIDLYNGVTGQWSVLSLPHPRLFMTAAAVGDQVLFAGGANASFKATGVVDIYNVSTGLWSSTWIPAHGFVFGGATTVGDKVLFVRAGLHENVVYIYNARRDSWSKTIMPDGNGDVAFGATSLGRYAIFAGGYNSALGSRQPSDAVDIYDTVARRWYTASLSVARARVGAATVDNQALFAGGYDSTVSGGDESYDAVDIFTEAPVVDGSLAGRVGRGVQVTVRNVGDVATPPGSVAVYASAGRALTLLGSASLGSSVTPRRSISLSIATSVPAGLAPGSYDVVAVLRSGNGTAPITIATLAHRLIIHGGASAMPTSAPMVPASVMPEISPVLTASPFIAAPSAVSLDPNTDVGDDVLLGSARTDSGVFL